MGSQYHINEMEMSDCKCAKFFLLPWPILPGFWPNGLIAEMVLSGSDPLAMALGGTVVPLSAASPNG